MSRIGQFVIDKLEKQGKTEIEEILEEGLKDEERS